MRGWLDEIADVEDPESAATLRTKVSTPSIVMDIRGIRPLRTGGSNELAVIAESDTDARRMTLVLSESGPKRCGRTTWS